MEDFGAQSLVSLKRQLVVEWGFGVIDDFELYPLNGLDSLNVNNADSAVSARTLPIARYLEEKFTGFGPVSHEAELLQQKNLDDELLDYERNTYSAVCGRNSARLLHYELLAEDLLLKDLVLDCVHRLAQSSILLTSFH